MGCGDHPLRMDQSASTERKTRACTNLCLPRPRASWSLSTAYDPGRWLIAATLGPTASASVSATAASVATATFTAAVLTALWTIIFHVDFISTSTKSTIGPTRTIAIFVFTNWNKENNNNDNNNNNMKIKKTFKTKKKQNEEKKKKKYIYW